ncbi:MAG: MFS transporter [Microbacteriaceae bacterium]|nr:MFS transporter [Burkholderiaceae bacterium]
MKQSARRRWGPWWPSLGLAPDDLLRDRVYRRLWLSILISSVGNQVTLLALPLTAALLLAATPTQMGLLIAVETLPFVLFSLPAGVWLDRVQKLPVYIVGEVTIALAVVTVPVVWWLGALSMSWLYAVGFVLGTVATVAGSAAQIVLTQVVPRERLVEAHARNALASSSAEVAGPGAAGLLIRLAGGPLALLVGALLLLASAAILRGVRVDEQRPPRADAHFLRDLREGLRFVRRQRLLLLLALTVGGWQLCHHAAQVVVVLHASRTLGLSEQAIGLCYAGLGMGTLAASLLGNRVSRRFGPGPSLLIGFSASGVGWLLPAVVSDGPWGVAALAAMLVLGGIGGVLMFINFLALRQAVTPEPLLGRMTTTMRWLILLPAAPGALLGGWVGEHVSLPAALGTAGVLALGMVLLVWRWSDIREVRALPSPEATRHDDMSGRGG